ncbi:MAG TPA: hypothetical protein P5244_15110 [Syntrophales bacterium]|nr:hypothetical protein [Syntrophales bacterium]
MPAFGNLTTTARHEAGHLLMLWLLDRQGFACGIADGCGMTKALDAPGEKETPHQHILYAMAGMVLSGDFDQLNDLRQHATGPDYFDRFTDSHYVAEALPHIGGDPSMVLSQFHDIILRLGSRFRKAHRLATMLLLEKREIAFDTLYSLFSEWDAAYGLVSRPKSDIVCRTIARAFRWRIPRGKFIGWDFKPLPEGYVTRKRKGMMEQVEMVQGQMVEWKM